MTASANSLKATVSALQRRLSSGADHAMSVAQKTNSPSTSRPIAKSRSHHGLLSMTAPRHPATDSTVGSDTLTRNFDSSGPNFPSRTSSYLGVSSTPQTGLSLAYDLHVRKSKSSLALTAPARNASSTGSKAYLASNRNSTANAPTKRTGFSHNSSLGYQYRRSDRPAPPAPVTTAFPSIDSPHRALTSTAPEGSVLPMRTPRPLPIPPVGIVRSQSSNLLRPTASSLARMQATVQPPSLGTSTPRAVAMSQQRTPFSRGNSASSLGAAASRVGAPNGTPHKKAGYLVPKSPHRRAMEKHTAAGRVIGTSGGIASAYKSKTSAASLAMSQKQREIEERRRARAHEGMLLF